MTKEELQILSFNIISNAGDALDCFYNSILNFKNNDLEIAKEKFNKGKLHLKDAHKFQTKLIQREANNEKIPYSLIMTHAQDHLNSAINWERMVNLLINND